jgi:hypothetical protein
MIRHLFHVPARAHPEDKAPARQQVEAGYFFRQDDRVTLDYQTDPGSKLERFGR